MIAVEHGAELLLGERLGLALRDRELAGLVGLQARELGLGELRIARDVGDERRPSRARTRRGRRRRCRSGSRRRRRRASRPCARRPRRSSARCASSCPRRACRPSGRRARPRLAFSSTLPVRTARCTVTFGTVPYGTSVTPRPLSSVKRRRAREPRSPSACPGAGGACFCAEAPAPRSERRRARARVDRVFFMVVSYDPLAAGAVGLRIDHEDRAIAGRAGTPARSSASAPA